MSKHDNFRSICEQGVEAARAVVDRWEQGDLASAVRSLNTWTDTARAAIEEERQRAIKPHPAPHKHDFDGACTPMEGGRSLFASQATFSVGVFQWLPKTNGKGLKKSAVKIRVKGYVHDPEKVYRLARELCQRLDTGWCPDKKTISV